jgi:microcystin-dependent protein
MSATSTDGYQASFPVPVGAIFSYAGGTTAGLLPQEYLICDGTSYLRTDYPELFRVIGTTFGSASGTTFNVPNMVGVFPQGSNTIGTRTTTSSVSAGTFAPTLLTSSQLPAISASVSGSVSGTCDEGLTNSSTGQADQDLVGGFNPLEQVPAFTNVVNVVQNSTPTFNYSSGVTQTPVSYTLNNTSPATFTIANTAMVFIIKSKSGFYA